MNLHLLQLGDSALPVGGYTHSWGLETAIARGQVRDAPALEHWCRFWLRSALGPLEGVVVAATCRAGRGATAHLREANALLEAALPAPSIRAASREMGEQMLALAASWGWSGDAVERL